MDDNKLTDTDIIKELEKHYRQMDDGYGYYLMWGGKRDEGQEKYLCCIRGALDILSRRQAENAGLNNECARLGQENDILSAYVVGLMERVEQLEAKNKRLTIRLRKKIRLSGQIDDLSIMYRTIKAEVVKEIVGMVKAKFSNGDGEILYDGQLIHYEIDNIAKGMVSSDK